MRTRCAASPPQGFALARGIQIRRRALRLTQKALASEVGVSQKTVANWENNVTSPNGQRLCALLSCLKASACQLRELGQNQKEDIRALIASTGLSLRQFSKASGISPALLQKALRNGLAGMSVETALQLCQALDIPFERLCAGYDSASRRPC